MGLGGLGLRQRLLTRRNQQLEEQVAEKTEALSQQNRILQRVNETLNDRTDDLEERNQELAESNRVIAEQAQRLKHLDVLKRQLIANASHELRTRSPWSSPPSARCRRTPPSLPRAVAASTSPWRASGASRS